MGTTLTPGQLGLHLKLTGRQAKKAMREGAYISAHRTVSDLKQKSPVYDGTFKNAWTPGQSPSSGSVMARVSNSSPIAGVIEEGARPHGVSQEGREAIREWVRKVIQPDTEAEVKNIAAGIIDKLRFHGQKGRHIVRNNLDKYARWAADEIASSLAKNLT